MAQLEQKNVLWTLGWTVAIVLTVILPHFFFSPQFSSRRETSLWFHASQTENNCKLHTPMNWLPRPELWAILKFSHGAALLPSRSGVHFRQVRWGVCFLGTSMRHRLRSSSQGSSKFLEGKIYSNTFESNGSTKWEQLLLLNHLAFLVQVKGERLM